MYLKTWFAPDKLLSQCHWTLMDSLWALAGYVVVENINEKMPVSSLTRDQKLFSLDVMWQEQKDINSSESHFYQDLVLVKIQDGKEFKFADIREFRKVEVEITKAIKKFSDFKNIFEAKADLKYCELWFEPNKPFHLLSEWNKSYLLRWAIEESLEVGWLNDSMEHGFINFEKESVKNTPNNDSELNLTDYPTRKINWKVKETLREKDYGIQLIALLRNFSNRELRPPSAEEVLKIWQEDLPWGIYEVTDDSFRYKLRSGRMSQIIPIKYLKTAIEGRIIWLD